eukprot:jgi/Chlat1/2961/Chrsp2S00363
MADCKLRWYLQDEDYLNSLDPLVDQLQKTTGDTSLNRKSVAGLVMQLLQFQEDVLGRQAPDPKPFTKLPVKLFYNTKPSGPLYTLLAKCYEHKRTQDWRRFDFQLPARRDAVLTMLEAVREELVSKGFLKYPKVFISDLVPAASIDILKATVVECGGSVASTEDEAGVSHALYPDAPAPAGEDQNEAWCRTIEVRGDEVKVHWWYYPDSYDEWMDEVASMWVEITIEAVDDHERLSDDVNGDIEEEEPRKGFWQLHVKWLRDTKVFNEWMNEIDYEVDEDALAAIAKQKAALHRISAAMSTARLTITVGFSGKSKHKAKAERLKPISAEDLGASKRKRETADLADIDGDDDLQGSKRHQASTEEAELAGKGEDYQPTSQVDAPANIPAAALEPQQHAGEIGAGPGQQVSSAPLVVMHAVQSPHESIISAAAADTAAASGRVTASSGAPQLENISQGHAGNAEQTQAAGEPTATQHGDQGAGGEKDKAKEVEKDRDRKEREMELYRVPAHAGWFQWDHIHDLERRGVPEFFNGRSESKTPKMYKQYRDFMINKFRSNPSQPLPFSECRKYLLGDVNAMLRIYQFLERWGLINYVPARPRTAPGDGGRRPPTPTVERESVSGMLVSTPAVPPLTSLYQFEARPPNMLQAAEDMRLSTRRQAYGAVLTSAPGAPGNVIEYHCNFCRNDCSACRYHCHTQPDVDLCPNCFANGRFPASTTTADFIRMDASQEANRSSSQDWTDQETLLLLEALELYGDKWEEVAEHVGTKNKAQCVLHFLRLPIEDQFLDEIEAGNGGVKLPTAPAEAASAAYGVVSNGAAPANTGSAITTAAPHAVQVEADEDVVPFADASNPIMAQVAFLASTVGPRVAAAAAQAALQALVAEEPSLERDAAEEALHNARAATKPSTEPASMPAVPEAKAEVQPGASAEVLPSPAVKLDVQSDVAPRPEEPRVPAVSPQPDATTPKPDEPAPMVTDMQPADASSAPAAPEDAKLTDAALKSSAVDVAMTAAQAFAEQTIRENAQDASPKATEAARDEPPGVLSAVKVKVAAATALAAAAVKAKLLADQEEREIQRLVATAIENQLKKVELKLRQFDELETLLEKEKEQVERARQQLYAEHLHFAASRLAPPPIPTTTSAAPKPIIPGAQQVTLTQPAKPLTPNLNLPASQAQARPSSSSSSLPEASQSQAAGAAQDRMASASAGVAASPTDDQAIGAQSDFGPGGLGVLSSGPVATPAGATLQADVGLGPNIAVNLGPDTTEMDMEDEPTDTFNLLSDADLENATMPL